MLMGKLVQFCTSGSGGVAGSARARVEQVVKCVAEIHRGFLEVEQQHVGSRAGVSCEVCCSVDQLLC